MHAQKFSSVRDVLAIVACCFAMADAGYAQTPVRVGQQSSTDEPQRDSQLNDEAERERIWDSANMLRARAWLRDYFDKSAKVTPDEASQYMAELRRMTPTQMKLWLLKFDHDEAQRQQQYAFWQQAQRAGIAQAMAANRQAQSGYAAINRDETAAAELEQQRLNEQTAAEQDVAEAKQLESVGPYGPGPYAYYPGFGGIHYHYHLYPYPYY
jgi:hypothetical protein